MNDLKDYLIVFLFCFVSVVCFHFVTGCTLVVINDETAHKVETDQPVELDGLKSEEIN